MRRLTELVVAEVLDVSHVQAADAAHFAKVADDGGDVVGRIAAQGKQEELLASCPLYRQMWQSYLGVRDGEEE